MEIKNPNRLQRILEAFKKPPIKVSDPINPVVIVDSIKKTTAPAGRVSQPPSNAGNNIFADSQAAGDTKIVDHQFIVELIPIIRSLTMSNPDVSQSLHNIVTLANPGHKVHFDKGVSTEQVDKMRNHLQNRRKFWAPGVAGMNGLINKWFSQLMIGGAISGEWVINKDLTGIESHLLVNPEEIVVTLDAKNTTYTYNQKSGKTWLGMSSGLIPLNPNTYRYYGLNGDTEIPYGIPPYLSVIPKIQTQHNMDTNINYVVDQLGLIGFLECLIQKPDQNVGEEGDAEYSARLDALLSTAKSRIQNGGLKDGLVVGFKDDHEFDFHSAAKEFGGVATLFQENELQIASALKTDAALWGRGYATSETQITVVFMKMLSELRNMQNIVKEMIEFGYNLELRLAGFKFDYLTVSFNRSTIQDDLKFQQAEEIKLRNVSLKYCMGLISLDTAADEMGYETPDEKEPRVPIELLIGKSGPGAGEGDAQQKAKRQKGKQDAKKKTKAKRKAL